MLQLIFLILFFLLSPATPSPATGSEETLFYIAPSQLDNTTREMTTAGFWISRHPSPDDVIMTQAQIASLNSHIQGELKLTKDIFAVTENFKAEFLTANLDKTLTDFAKKGYYTRQGVSNDPAYFDQARQNMNLPGMLPGVGLQYGLIVHYADVRFFPTEQGLYETQGDFDFDQVQNSTYDVGTPVVVVHQSADKKWYYVLSSLCDGWVKAENIAIGDMKAVQGYAQPKVVAVVTSPKTDIYLNESMTDFNDYARMGARFPYIGAAGGQTKILLPTRDNEGQLKIVPAFVDRTEVHKGFLPYTARVIYRQAFAMLNQPYGWGGMFGQQDCSAFLVEVFGTVGIVLPRNSRGQASIKDALVEFEEKTTHEERLEALKKTAGPSTILGMKGHILIYLGMIDNRPYAIHSLWAYREKDRNTGRDVPRVTNRVVVSDLSLGETSQKGSLLKRLTRIMELK